MVARNSRSGSGFRKSKNADAGEAAELFVAVDLLCRGLEVTKPLNRATKDDLHARFKVGWRNIQVKVGKVSLRTQRIIPRRDRRCSITSEIIAWVDLVRLRILYEGNGEPLPAELQ